MYIISESLIQDFQKYLYLSEKSNATIKKYVHAVSALQKYLKNTAFTKMRLLEYREYLQKHRKAQTVNGILSAINSFLEYCGWQECKVKFLNVQRPAFLDDTRELSETEYRRLLKTAYMEGNVRLYMIMMTLCSTGIRVSELSFITVDAVEVGKAEICMKGKNRIIIIQKELRKKLQKYVKERNIKSGVIFRTRTGKPIDRSNIWHEMKTLCDKAKVDPRKVFPHNFRHLFARTFYALEKNLAYLGDILGHSRIETTRLYIATSITTHERILNRMKLVKLD